jgi:iron complex outermembrane receptor protein
MPRGRPVACCPAAERGISMRKSLRLHQALGGGAAALALAGGWPALAQQQGIETVVVTAQKRSENIQNVPIAISAFTQKELKTEQVAGGPDLIKEVPNLTFSKTNFTGYNIQIRGIGTQAVSATTDPAVAVAFNNIPFIRNHFFEQEFFDVEDVEVLRGPQGTLYGRNAPAGVVNVVSAKPTDQYEANASVDVGNYGERRLEGMVNIPIVEGDKLSFRAAGEWTKRDGYETNQLTGQAIDGRDLWSGRATLHFEPFAGLKANLVWEHFYENDNRARSTKQLCTKDPGPSVVNGPAGPQIPTADNFGAAWLTQGCLPGSLYGPSAFQTPNAGGIPFVVALELFTPYVKPGTDPYAGQLQPQDLRVVDSLLNPKYKAKNDTVEFNVDYALSSTLSLASQTGFNRDFLYSTEDYNRFNTVPIFLNPGGNTPTLVGKDNQYCDPQLGCSSSIVGQDVSQEKSEQFYEEMRLSSNFDGPLNFVLGGNYMHYHTEADYFVFYNALSLFTEYVNSIFGGNPLPANANHIPFDPALANSCNPIPADPNNLDQTQLGLGCAYIDPNALANVDGKGHNYFLSKNPYRLNSWAGFGEAYYQLTPDLKLTGGLRFTDDQKTFTEFPSWAGIAFKGIPSAGVLVQEWKEFTGRFVGTWTPKLDFTDDSLFYASYSRGYKAGGANPPGVVPIVSGGVLYSNPITHPAAFEPEFVNAFELGTKNTILNDTMTLNGSVFYYDYKNYQISQIVDRTSVNLNFDANVKGAEVESTWHPIDGLTFNFSGGYQDGKLAKGTEAIDLMDRTNGNSDWMLVRPFITGTSNCVLPVYVVNELLAHGGITIACTQAYSQDLDPVTGKPYVPNPDPKHLPGYVGFDPKTAPNGGQGFLKNLGGNQLPNSPHLTVSFGAQYTLPLGSDWAATLRGDVYHQSGSFARVFNDKPYDELKGYTNVNLSLTFADADGWDAMLYVKNLFNATAITGAFLNSDDTALTTNVFVTDPRLYGIRISKAF